MRKTIAIVTLMAFVGIMGGCVTAGMPKPQTPAQSLIYVEGLYITALNTANELATKRIIDLDTARDIQQRAHQADGYLDQAHVLLNEGDTSGAIGQMRLAQSLLDVLILELQAHQQKGGK